MTISEQDRQKATDILRRNLLPSGEYESFQPNVGLRDTIAVAIAQERERADRYRAALRKVPDYTSDGGCTWCGAEERVVYADRVYQEGEPHKSDCPRVLMPEVWEEKA